jgi:hypothetical protein
MIARATTRRLVLAALCAVAPFLHTRNAPAEDGAGGGGGKGRGGAAGGRAGPPWIFRTDVPAHDIDVVLGRPTRDSVVVSVRTTADSEGCVEWRPANATQARRTPIRPFPAGSPVEIRLDGLSADTACVARILSRQTAATELTPGEELSFHTQRPRGAAFAFTVIADSHLDNGTDPALYERTVRNVADSRPDFHVDLGDTFMTDKYRNDFHGALAQYVAQRWYFGLLRVPAFLVLGNHDGEVGWRDRGTADDMPRWSNTQRKRLFPNPEPDSFYTGNATRDRVNGLLENWYAWEWGDALFLALDPFWSTTDRKGRDADPWSWTLGDEQYHWLEKTLAAHPAKFRFVFIHHLVGGLGPEARGGAEVAGRWEWGGKTAEGKDEFAARRPGWSAPIHTLLARAGPTVVLHGHDHFFAHQTLDGVIYQMVPQPGHSIGDVTKMAAEYGYVSGDFLASPGHLRVQVSSDTATVEYVRAAKAGPLENAKVAFSYRVPAAAR